MDGIKYTEFMGENVKDKLKYCGNNVRILNLAKIINPEFAEIDDNSIILDYTFIDAKESFKLGKYSTIAWHCVIEGWAHISIGDRCFLGPGSKLLGSTYKYNGFYTSEHLPDGTHETDFGDITICNDAYIGANSVIMPGVTVGEGAMIGANALVTKNCKPWGIYFGNPARCIGEREKPTEDRRKIVEQMDWSKNFDR